LLIYNSKEYSECRRGWTTGVPIPGWGNDSPLRHRVQTGSRAHPTSYQMGIGGSIPGGKAAAAWSSPLASIQCRV
jgi:hypothetical protein